MSTAISTVKINEGGAELMGSEFINRDLSWLEFNRRVLHEALDERTPLLERVRFLSIFNSNLDEFYQKRVALLKRQIAAKVTVKTPDGTGPSEQYASIRQHVERMLRLQADAYTNRILPALREHGIHLLSWEQLTPLEQQWAKRYFRDNLFPVLTPLTVDPGHPFPFISNLSLSLGVLLRQPNQDDGDSYAVQFARVKVPSVLPPWVRLDSPTAGHRYISLEQIIRHNLQDLFEGMTIEEIEPFRVTRSADVERDEEEADDLIELIEQELRDRRFAPAIRLEVSSVASASIMSFLMHELELSDSEIYLMPGPLEYNSLRMIADLNIPELKYEPWAPTLPPRLADEDAGIFSLIRSGDILVHHPYESFKASVERFISTAASDPKVIAIKLAIYRTSADSPFIPELIRAAETGKQVVALVEIKARFDEETNIRVAQQLEKTGVHVVYGMVGLKTHAKIAIVVRQEAAGMRVYAHIGTGNYNSKTAQLYTDLGLFTARPEITADLVELFHHMTGRSQKLDFRQLLVAPINMRRRFMEMIDREIIHAELWKKRGGQEDDPARPMIIAKMNSLEDQSITRKLYQAGQAGVKIKLIVRGFCCLRPGVPDLSENISVISVVGRFLEHSRIFYFHNAGNSEYYIGSADWMYRNLYHRVECITPVLDPGLQQRLKHILDVMLQDRRQAWDMQPDGGYIQRTPDPSLPGSGIGTHRQFMEFSRKESQRPDAD